MDYIKWNKALISHFFYQKNEVNEIILYADKTLINEIGQKENLGNYDDFLTCILIDFDKRCDLYSFINHSKSRPVEINRSLKNKITDFPQIINEANKSYDLIFFNYIIFYITIYLDNTDDSFYRNINSVISKFLPLKKRVNTLDGLDHLFEEIEKWTTKKRNGIFRARRIGQLSYMGLLNYQVVLKPEENSQFEETLYKHQIILNDNAIYPELANKIFPYIGRSTLRDKLKKAIKKQVYAEWFLNRALNFDHERFSESEKGEKIQVFRKGNLAFKINTEKISLQLVTDTFLRPNDIPDVSFSPSGKDKYGYYNDPIITSCPNRFQDVLLSTNDKSLELRNIKINEANFFQKADLNYIQTLHPQKNYDIIVVVSKNNKAITNWEEWASNGENIDNLDRITSNNLQSIFGENFVFYSASNIKQSYYRNIEDGIIYSTNFTDNLYIKKLGGLKVNNNLYLDVGLPHFELQDNELDFNDFNIKIYRNGAIDKDIEFHCEKSTCHLFCNEGVIISQASIIIVKFLYKNLERSFDFSIVGTELKTPAIEDLFKYDKWGVNGPKTEGYIRGNSVINGKNIELNASKHCLSGLKEKSSYNDNYFIFLLTAIFYKSDKNIITRKNINSAIDAALSYLESKKYIIREDKFSRYNLINNLIALGYINSIKNEGNHQLFQLLPPGILKIEKVLNSNTQVYQLTGARTRFMIQKIVAFCDENNIQIKFKRYNISENNSLEKALLPEIIYIDINKKLEKYLQNIKENFEQQIHVEQKYHLGDTLLHFIASIADFEKTHLKTIINLENQRLNYPKDSNFPRIIESQGIYIENGQTFVKKFIEKTENEFYNNTYPKWSKLFIAHVWKTPLLLMKRRFGDQSYNYAPELLIPSKIKLPEVVYRCCCIINHGIPKTIKVFLKNANDHFNVQEFTFMNFDQYNFSEKVDRREQLARILTGSTNLDDNPQILYMVDNSKNKMEFLTCTIDSDIKHALIIKDNNDQFIGLRSNYKQLFVNVKYIKNINHQTSRLTINDQTYNVLLVKKEESTTNQLLSKILNNETSELKFKKPPRDLSLNINTSEKIFIKEL